MMMDKENRSSDGAGRRPDKLSSADGQSTRRVLSFRTGLTFLSFILFGFGIYAPCTVYRLLPGIPLLSNRHIVDVGYAKYLGKQTKPNTVAYLGIPYAQAPIGNLRFRRPAPLDVSVASASNAVIDARTYPDFCVQGYAPWVGPDDRGGAGSEDCLKVNVFTPVCAKPDDALPVLAYIHGGGYTNGNPANWPFDEWVNSCPNFIAVHIYYRLSAFGFLAAPTSPSFMDLNAGLHDQREGLRWIKSHISAFGGDPNRVTISGQSAGGGSVFLQMLADEATGEQLFSGVIPQSLARTAVPRAERKREAFLDLARKARCARESIEKSLECLREASISDIIRAADDLMKENPSTYYRWMPVVDNELIVDYPTRLFQQGKHVKVPVMVGHTTNEGGGQSLRQTLQNKFPAITEDDLRRYEELYPETDPLCVQNALGEAELRCGTHLFGSVLFDVYAYRYNQPTPPLRLPGSVGHSSDNWMQFEGTMTGSNGTTVFHPLSTAQRDFFHELLAYWTSFVRSGNPNTFKLDRSPIWPPYSGGASRAVLQHQPNTDLGTDAADAKGTTAIWMEEVDEGERMRCDSIFGMVESEEN